MSRPVEQVLSNLIPRHSNILPPELVDTACSLLAQSKTKCPLKAEEEIARTYVCAHIACERLKTTLNLPPIEPRPPLPPRVYNKLYAYLSRELTAPIRRTQVSRSKSAQSTPTKPLPQRQPPSKEASLSTFRTNRTPRKGLQHLSTTEKEARVPRWIPHVTRLLCKDLATPKAMPHILAGVESILTMPAPAGGAAQVQGKIPALIAAVWFFVVTRMRGPVKQGMENMARKTQVREVISAAKEDEAVRGKVGVGEGAWAGFDEGGKWGEREVNEWRKEILRGQWRDLDWWANVEEGVGVEGELEEAEDVQSDADGEADAMDERIEPKHKVVIDRYDYLSDENRQEYAQWKATIYARIKELAAEDALSEGAQEMDTAD